MLRVVLTGVLLASPVAASAHPLTFTETTLTLGADQVFTIDLVVDLDALAAGRPAGR